MFSLFGSCESCCCGHMCRFCVNVLFILGGDLAVDLLGYVVTLFNHLSNHQTAFHSGCTFIMEVPISPWPHQHLSPSIFFSCPSGGEVVSPRPGLVPGICKHVHLHVGRVGKEADGKCKLCIQLLGVTWQGTSDGAGQASWGLPGLAG